MSAAKTELTDLDKEIILAMADCNMCDSKVSRKLYVYRTTVGYRAKRIKEVTGLNIKNFYELCSLVSMLKDDGSLTNVVRCKNCEREWICRMGQLLGADGYCSEGVRKDDG